MKNPLTLSLAFAILISVVSPSFAQDKMGKMADKMAPKGKPAAKMAPKSKMSGKMAPKPKMSGKMAPKGKMSGNHKM